MGPPPEVTRLETTSPTSLYSRTLRNWAGGQLLRDVVMEQWIRLEGPAAEVRFRFEYSGKESPTTEPGDSRILLQRVDGNAGDRRRGPSWSSDPRCVACSPDGPTSTGP